MSARAILVTGAGSGLGRAITLTLAGQGDAVLALDRDAAGLAETARLYAGPGRIATHVADITTDAAPREAVAATLAAFGRIDALVNNAGIGRSAALDATSDADFDRYMDINLRAAVRFSREALGHLPAPGGAIVHIASIFGILGYPGMASYSVSKAALIGLTHQMAADYGPRGIRVNAVAPGLIDTPLVHDRIGPGTRVHALMVQTTPFPRIGRPQDIADAVQFLLSDKAAFINGHVLAVDGGWSVTNWVAGAPPE